MKKLLIILLLFTIHQSVFGQTPEPTGVYEPHTFKYHYFPNYIRVGKGVLIDASDTASVKYIQPGIKFFGTKPHYYIPSAGRWFTFLNTDDTTGKWGYRLSRTPGQDSICIVVGGIKYCVKDSTGGAAIDTANHWVNRITNNATNDSIIYYIGTTRYAVKDNGAGGSGETNTASNLGGGLANYSTKVGVDLQFNSFLASDFNITSNVIGIDYTNGQAATSSVKGFATPAQIARLDSNFYIITPTIGEQIAHVVAVDRLRIKSLIAGSGITITGNDSTLTITNSGGGSTITNIGTGISLGVDATNNIKKIAFVKSLAGDSTTTANTVTAQLLNDSTTLVNDSKYYGYDGTTRGWKDGLKITITSPAANQGLMYNGTNWVNGTFLIPSDSANHWVNRIANNATNDSIIYWIGTTRFAIKDNGAGGSGVTTMAAIGSSPNANGATISGVNLNLEPASASFGGVVTTGTQTFAGAKTFSSDPTFSAMTANRMLYTGTGGLASSSANATFNGSKLAIAGSATASTFSVGSYQTQSLGTNNSFIGDNVQYTSGFKAVANGYTPMIYFPNGDIEMYTSPTTATAGSAANQSPKLRVTGGGVVIHQNVSGLTASANLLLGNVISTAGTSPLKFYLTGAVAMTTAEVGAVEPVTTKLNYTNSMGVRQQLQQSQPTVVTTQYDNTTTTLGNVTGLTATVAAAGVYRFEAKLYTTSNVAGGVKAAIAGTATATNIVYDALVYQGGVSTGTGTARGAAMAAAVGDVTAVTTAFVKIEGTITVNAAGTLTVQLAANAATGTTSALIGSTFVVYQIQ